VSDRNPVQRADRGASRQRIVRETRALHRLLGAERHDGVDGRVDAGDAIEVRGYASRADTSLARIRLASSVAGS
jgi:hypothetical protein